MVLVSTVRVILVNVRVVVVESVLVSVVAVDSVDVVVVVVVEAVTRLRAGVEPFLGRVARLSNTPVYKYIHYFSRHVPFSCHVPTLRWVVLNHHHHPAQHNRTVSYNLDIMPRAEGETI